MSRKSKRDEEIAAICGPLGQCLRAVFTSHQAQQTLLLSLWHPSTVKCCTDMWSGCLSLPTATGPLVPPLPLGRCWAALGGSSRAIFPGCFQQPSGAESPLAPSSATVTSAPAREYKPAGRLGIIPCSWHGQGHSLAVTAGPPGTGSHCPGCVWSSHLGSSSPAAAGNAPSLASFRGTA